MNSILLSDRLVKDIEQSEIDYMRDRMEAIQGREHNPELVEIAYIGRAMCLYSKTMPWPAFNTIKGITSEDIEHIDEMIAFYRARDRKAQFEIVPSRVDQQLLQRLSDRGYYQSGFHVSMYGTPDAKSMDLPDDIRIEELGADEFVTYATIHCRGTGLPDSGITPVANNNRVLWNRPGWKFFLAYISDQPAAAAVMFTARHITSLTFAATLPEYRNQGLHQYLLRKRMMEADQLNSRLIVGQCAYLSQSHRNMERAGLKIGYIRTTWSEKPGEP